MQQYRVTYSLGSLANPNNSLSSFNGQSTNLQFLETVITASGPGQAQRIVENQFGGAQHCRVHSAYPIY